MPGRRGDDAGEVSAVGTAQQSTEPSDRPRRDIPVPTSVSPEAQAMLASGPTPAFTFPELDDLAGWRAFIATAEKSILKWIDWATPSATGVDVLDTNIDGVPVIVATPPNLDRADPRVFLMLHGGALVVGAGACCRAMAVADASRLGIRVWAIDHRMPPEHPYPAGLDDCVIVYRALLEQREPDEIVVGGTSAGANLAAALVLRARDEGLPLPAAAVLLSPQVDLTESGDSFQTMLGVDTVLTQSLMPANLLYSGGQDLTDPYLSPLFGDFEKGFVPTLLSSGTRDLFLSNAVRMHRALRAAGIPAELHVVEAAPHGGFHGIAPEDLALDAELRRFIDDHIGR